MANPERRRPENAEGAFFVDSTCIDCDTCRWMAPEVFTRVGEMSAVSRQPDDPRAERRALQALISCPTASIGTAPRVALGDVLESFPIPVAEGVFHCGFHHESSFGAASYLLQRPGGNVLVDSPRFAKPLVRRLEELGGVATLFLTHKDDVGDHERFAEHFGCERVLHAADADGPLREVERLLEGESPIELGDGLLVLPVPGHTRGSCCLLVDERYLFSGDHVAWSARLEHVYAFRTACWYDWDVQIASMERLASHAFEWILPGHGRRCHFEAEQMVVQMQRCIAWMRTA
jgi:glyoxylase-like metal-dependent hydrolase (beta-lactamase superfamily II)/ferredoxin